MIRKGNWIEIEQLVYPCKDLSVQVFVRGNCLSECDIGEEAEIKTITGHKVRGIVAKDRPLYNNIRNLGKDVKEILMIKGIKN